MRHRSSIIAIALIVAAIALVALATPAWAGIGAQPGAPPSPAANAPPAIHLQAGTFVPAAGEGPDLPESLADEGPSLSAMGAGDQVLVQFEGPILPEWRAALEAAGARVAGYVPDFAYLVELEGASADTLYQVEGVIWVGPYLPGYRVSPDAAAEAAASAAEDGVGALLRVDLAGDAAPGSVDALIAGLPGMGARLVAQEGNTLTVQADEAALATLARFPQVSWVGRMPAPPRVHNDVATGQVRADQAWSLGYQGDGQIVNIADTGLDSGRDLPHSNGDMHADLDNRVNRIHAWPVRSAWDAYILNRDLPDTAADLDSGHGTHVAGTAVGNGASLGGQYSGIAPRARLTFQALERYCVWSSEMNMSPGYYLVGVPADLNDLFVQAHDWGARVHNVSWGNNEQRFWGAYDNSAQQADQFVDTHRDAVIVVAVGNEGRDADGDRLTDYYSVVPPATAKNVIAVGATENYRPSLTRTYGEFKSGLFIQPIAGDPMADVGINGLMATSGRGPTLDGRQVPHLVAPGTWIASLRSSVAENAYGWGTLGPHYMYFGGTSMSAPQVTGAAALVRQAYAARGHQPSAALVKATLIQTARDIPGQYPGYDEAGAIPNYNEGWGALDVEAAVLAAAGREYVDETHSLGTGQEATHSFVVGTSTQPARFTLVWTDPAALLTAGKQLVNDLDLEVVAPDGHVYRGNGFSGGWSAVGGNADRTNNVEAVYIAAPAPGVYTVRVRGYNVPLGPQDYALLAQVPRVPAAPAASLRLPLVARGMAAPTAPANPAPGPSPTPRATATPLPTAPAATPTVAPGEFRDDFSAVDGMWIVTSTTTFSMAYTADEAYAIRVLPARHKVGSLPRVTGSSDMLLEVEARTTVTASQAYGLIFNSRSLSDTQEEYHAFLVSPSGWWALMRSEADGDWLEVEWTESRAIARGTAANRLSVRREGERVELAVNGEVVRVVRGSAYTDGNRFGLLAAAWGPHPAEAVFDDVRMLPLERDVSLQSFAEGRAVEGASGVAPPP